MINDLTAEAVAELLGVRALSKAEDEHVGIVAAEGVVACAKRQLVLLAEKADRCPAARNMDPRSASNPDPSIA